MQIGISNAQLNSAIVYTLRNVAFFLDGWRRGQNGVQMIYGKHRLRVHTNAACWAVAQTHFSLLYPINIVIGKGGDIYEG